MKTLSVVNTILCVILVAGVCFVAMRMEQAVVKMDEMKAAQEEKTRELSDEISRAWTRIGEVEATSGRLAQRIESLSSKEVVTADLESEIKKIMGDQRQGQMRRWQREAERWQGAQLKPEQRELATKMMQQGAKDLMDLQAKVQAGEVTREEARRIMMERWQGDLAKFRGALEKDKDEKPDGK